MPKYLDKLNFTITGASHSESIVTSLDGIPSGLTIDLDALQSFCDRRKSVNPTLTTPRREEDTLVVKSGFDTIKGKSVTTGDTIEVVVFNKVNNSRDYDSLKNIPRPSHADYTALARYGDSVDLRGGGRFSGRLTLGHSITGGIAKQLLSSYGVSVTAYIGEIAGIKGKSYSDGLTINECESVDKTFAVIGDSAPMIDAITKARLDGDSVGGVVECIVWNMPVGVGGELDDGLEGKIAGLLYSIPAVKGVEFGSGFGVTRMKGSVANDSFYYDNGTVKTKTNNNGGINGGISNGMPITIRVAFKPTPSISKEQDSVNLKTGENVKLSIGGRHDACIVPRAVVAVEATVCLAIYDSILQRENY